MGSSFESFCLCWYFCTISSTTSRSNEVSFSFSFFKYFFLFTTFIGFSFSLFPEVFTEFERERSNRFWKWKSPFPFVVQLLVGFFFVICHFLSPILSLTQVKELQIRFLVNLQLVISLAGSVHFQIELIC